MDSMRFDSERIYIRSITYDDTDTIVKWRAQDNVKRYFIYRGELTKEVHNNWMRTQVETGRVVQFIVCMKEDDRPIGSVYLRDIDRQHSKAEYGVFLGEEDIRGMGIGQEALRLVLDVAFKILGLNRVYARALADNEASINCFLECGFKKEAHLRQSVCLDGIYRDVVLIGKLSTD